MPPPPVLPSPRLPKAVLLELLEKISGVQSVWKTDQRPHLGQRPLTEHSWTLLGVQSYQSVGVDELRQVYDPPPIDANNTILVGQRQFTLVVECYSLDANLEAFDLAERVRFRLRSQVARGIFSPAGLSLRDIQPAVTVARTVDAGQSKRALLASIVDVRWNLVVYADPLDPGEDDYIQTVDTANVVPGTFIP
jgi:hypothetical protein